LARKVHGLGGERALSGFIEGLPSNERALREVAVMVFDRVLGRSSSAAVVVRIGDDAFSDPHILVAKLASMFGEGSGILVQEMVDASKGGIKATA
jgi:hypothetical protein